MWNTRVYDIQPLHVKGQQQVRSAEVNEVVYVCQVPGIPVRVRLAAVGGHGLRATGIDSREALVYNNPLELHSYFF